MNFAWFLLLRFKDQILRGITFILFGIFIVLILAQFTNFSKVLALTIQSLGRINLLVLIFFGLILFSQISG